MNPAPDVERSQQAVLLRQMKGNFVSISSAVSISAKTVSGSEQISGALEDSLRKISLGCSFRITKENPK